MTRTVRRRTREQKRQETLQSQGYVAGFSGRPCLAPTTREIDRAAWEQGWRAGHRDLADFERNSGVKSPELPHN